MQLPDQLPHPSQRRIAVHVKPAAERALRDGHPWVFDQSIRQQSKAGSAGDLAVIFDKKDRFLAVGLYDPDSPIRVKILQHHTPATINTDFYRDTLSHAFAQRAPLADKATDGYRLVYGEGDQLPGLVIDRYGTVLVLKLYSTAWISHLRDVLTALNDLMPEQTLVLRLSRNLQQTAEHGLHDGMILQGTLPDVVRFQEYGLWFEADVIDGHKTGFFFDQRENRQRVRDLATDQRVLDVFSYNGGFSVNAAAGGARAVTSLDVSAQALASAQANMTLNQNLPTVAQCRHEIMVADAFEGLAQLADANTRYDLVIIDPPTFASSQDQVAGALGAYSRLVHLGLNVLVAGGTLVMASCSSRVPAEDFFALVHHSAMQAERPLQEIARTRHALDHPITFAEGAYLKCLFARA
ncbi:MAG: class I SAM-dependent rRNA methyltransferase [Anaerolineae bacterium]